MGKRGSDLCQFIKEGLRRNKYPNLKWISDNPLTFSIYFPRKTTKLDPAFEQFLKDWRALKHKPYTYSMAKQAVETALKKSDFFKKMPSSKVNTIIYQILDEDAILEKKKSKGIRVKEEYQNPLSVESSGYGSGGDTGYGSSGGTGYGSGGETGYGSGGETGYGSGGDTENSFTASDEEMECKIDDVHVIEQCNEQFVIEQCNEQFVIVQNIEDSSQVAVPYLFEDLDTSSEYDLVSVNPNDIIIDERNNIWPHFEKMLKEEIGDQERESTCENHDDCHTMDSLDPYYLQHAFSEMDLKSFEGEAVDLNELMNIDVEDFQEMEKKPDMQTYYLKEVKCTDDGEVLIFSPNAFEEMKGIKNEPNLKDESRIAVNSEQMGKISAAICSPLNIGLINGEIHLCLKH